MFISSILEVKDSINGRKILYNIENKLLTFEAIDHFKYLY